MAAARRRGDRGRQYGTPVFVYTTYPSIVEAEQAAARWSSAGSAPASNILPGMVFALLVAG